MKNLSGNQWALAASPVVLAMSVALAGKGGGITPGGGDPPPPPPPPPVGEPFDACGTIQILMGGGIMCANLALSDGTTFLLDDLGDFDDGAAVCVSGTVLDCFAPEFLCGPIEGCIRVESITADKGGKTVSFAGCGEIVPGPQGCMLLHADSGQTFAINTGDAKAGDRVHVSGDVAPKAAPCAPQDVATLDNVQITPCFAAADFNHDGSVNGIDLGALLSQWGQAGAADLNGDGSIDGIDLGALLSQWS